MDDLDMRELLILLLTKVRTSEVQRLVSRWRKDEFDMRESLIRYYHFQKCDFVRYHQAQVSR
jgi:hypothetical protein